MSKKSLENLKDFMFVVPALILIFVFIAYPFACSVYYSFTDWNGISKANFVGITNYAYLFQDNYFKQSLKNTLFFTAVPVLIMMPCSLLLALVLNSEIKGRAVLRTMFYLPSAISLVVISNLWSIILAYEGILNKLFESIGLSNFTMDWLGDYDRTPWVIIMIVFWQGLGYTSVFFIAGLQTIPIELYEAGKIDGIGTISKFFKITLPLLMPTVTVVLFMQLTHFLKLFDIPFIMTNGGPGNVTKTLTMEIYNQAFASTAGYAATTGIILLLIAVVISTLQIKLTGSKEVEL